MTTEMDEIAALLPEVELVPLGIFVATLGERHIMQGAPFGTRRVVDVTGIRVEGDRLNASMAGTAAADWGTLGADEVFQLDVRATLRTDDDALIFVQYNGRLDLSDTSAPGPVYCAPRFETGDPRYLWLNTVQAVMKGRSEPPTWGRISYRMYEMR